MAFVKLRACFSLSFFFFGRKALLFILFCVFGKKLNVIFSIFFNRKTKIYLQSAYNMVAVYFLGQPYYYCYYE